ncbi:hypothetical protein GCM10010176_033840 [Nonomuraea spiralis]|nr:hypothetical protein GCM10010176_033840 [Nonomuraea spiralis]
MPFPSLTDRMVKYIANSAAKNMSSEDSHTIVPTLTRFGRRYDWAVVVEVIADAVATGSIIAAPVFGPANDPPLGGTNRPSTWDNWDKTPVRPGGLGLHAGAPVRSR